MPGVDPGPAAIEELLTCQHVNRFKYIAAKGNKPGRRERLATHARVELFREKNAHVSELLMAVKWIGNKGSHDEIQFNELVDGLAIFERALIELYDDGKVTALRKAREFNKSNLRVKRPAASKGAPTQIAPK